MAGLPYPTHDTGFPFPDSNPNNPYGQVAEGSLPYPTSDVPGAFPYPPEAYPNTNIGIPICPATEPVINAVNVPYPYLPYPIEALPGGAPGAVPFPSHDHSIGDSPSAYPFSFPTPEQNVPYSISSSTGDSSQGYPPSSGFDGKDIAEKVEYNEGLRKSLFSKSGLIGKAIDKGILEKSLKNRVDKFLMSLTNIMLKTYLIAFD